MKRFDEILQKQYHVPMSDRSYRRGWLQDRERREKIHELSEENLCH